MDPGEKERAEREPGPERKSVASGIVAESFGERARRRFIGVNVMLDEAVEFPMETRYLRQEALRHVMQGAYELEQALRGGGAA
jgi:hypothetical protein